MRKIKPCVIMRSRNDMPVIAETLLRLHEQSQNFELIVFDNESRDGTLEELRKYTDRIINVPEGTYVPGCVLNQAMENLSGEFVVFLNSDCIPRNNLWLENLLKGFTEDNIAAVFGRQIPRHNCQPLFFKDTEDTYGDGSRQKKWRHCFSMASSVIRRSVWEKIKFNENIQYSEDIEWSWRARNRGFLIHYVPDSVVTHSHNYTLRQFYKRHYGEGKAEAAIFDWSLWERSLLRYSLLPYVRQVSGDWKYSILGGYPLSFFYSPVLRTAQLLGRRAGFQAERENIMKPVYPVRTPPIPVGGNNKIADWSAMLPSSESQNASLNGVYAKHASKKFNEYLHNVLERIAVDTKNALGENLIALLLGGGYGRGEGGVVVRDGKERPYNDIDFTLVVRSKRKLSENILLEISKKYEKEIKIHVDFSRPLTISDIKNWPHWLMWQDLIKGNKVLAGSHNVFRLHAPEKLLKPLPAIEATRLLLNRGSGILLALRVMRGLEAAPDKDFVRRNYFKCALSLGDALMILYRCYESNYHGRHDRFVRLVKKSPELASFQLEEIYKSSLDFKFRPDALPDAAPSDADIKNLIRLWNDIFLFVENKRTNKNFSTLSEYSKWNGLRETDENKFTRWSRNIIRNIQNGRFSLKYPREALFRKLPALLDSENYHNLKWDKKSRWFLTVWERFN